MEKRLLTDGFRYKPVGFSDGWLFYSNLPSTGLGDLSPGAELINGALLSGAGAEGLLRGDRLLSLGVIGRLWSVLRGCSELTEKHIRQI